MIAKMNAKLIHISVAVLFLGFVSTQSQQDQQHIRDIIQCKPDGIEFKLNLGDSVVMSDTSNVSMFLEGQGSNPACSVGNVVNNTLYTLTYTDCNVQTVQFLPFGYWAGARYVLIDADGNQHRFSVGCTYGTVEITGNLPITNASSIDHGGDSGHATSELTSGFQDSSGKTPESVRLGEDIKFLIQIANGSSYAAIQPETCVVHDGSNTPNARFEFVVEGCPQPAPMTEIEAMRKVDDRNFLWELRAFQFSLKDMELHITCSVRLCIKAKDCYKKCWGDSMVDEPNPDTNSTDTGNGTASLIRHKRQVDSLDDESKFQELSRVIRLRTQSNIECESRIQTAVIYTAMFSILIVLVGCAIVLAFMMCRRQHGAATKIGHSDFVYRPSAPAMNA